VYIIAFNTTGGLRIIGTQGRNDHEGRQGFGFRFYLIGQRSSNLARKGRLRALSTTP
jgi:hypothetical protein